MISCYLSESRSNLSVGVKTSLVHKTVESFASENGFDFAEDSFNGVELWRITHIVNALNMEAWPPLAQFFGLVHRQRVHEQGNRLVAVSAAKLFEVLAESLSVNGLSMGLTEAYPMLFCH